MLLVRLGSIVGEMDLPPYSPDEMYPEVEPPPRTLMMYVTIQPMEGEHK